MPKTINEAIRDTATDLFFSFKAERPNDAVPPGVNMTKQEWQSLSPGYRREIARQFGGE